MDATLFAQRRRRALRLAVLIAVAVALLPFAVEDVYVQNILIRQGPVQRWFGISDLIVLTAGGAVTGSKGEGGRKEGTGHRGLIEGISAAKAVELRERILQKLRASATAGLGDEAHAGAASERLMSAAAWTAAHLEVLREIRDAVANSRQRA